MRTFFVFVVMLLTLSNQAFAWSIAGHRIIASIAFRQLTPNERDRVVEILREHPRFAEDFLAAMPTAIRNGSVAERNEWLFQQAALWPDLLRPERPPERFTYHRDKWHYINLPHFLTPAARLEMEQRIDRNVKLDPPDNANSETAELNAVQVIRMARRVCGDPQVASGERAVWLAWLFHNVGDLHQPLHSTALFSSRLFRNGDNGGNFVRTDEAGNLHSLWDRFPGGNIRFQDARNRALAMRADARLTAAGQEAAALLDEREWLRESHYLAVAAAYDPAILVALRDQEAAGRTRAESITLPEDYLKMGGSIAETRLIQAGYRLAESLKEIIHGGEGG